MNRLRILKSGEGWVAIQKPPGFHVHSPEESRGGRFRISPVLNCLRLLRVQLGRPVFPVHRLDRPTGGIVLFALESSIASALAQQFSDRTVEKEYIAWVAGELPGDLFLDSPMRDSSRAMEQEALTRIFPITATRLDGQIVTLVRANPHTGRRHQIRRHLKRAGFPILGDAIHGKKSLNEWYACLNQRILIGRLPELALHHAGIRFREPSSQGHVEVRTRWGGDWLTIFDNQGVCPVSCPREP